MYHNEVSASKIRRRRRSDWGGMFMYCSNCGNEVSTGVNFCMRCGTAIKRDVIADTGKASYKQEAQAPKKMSKAAFTALVSTAIGIVLITIASLIYFLIWLPVVNESRNQERMEARILSVFRVTGGDVNLIRAGGSQTRAWAGMGLHAGYQLATGYDSFCYISLDMNSIVKMDVSTDILVVQANERRLRISLSDGQVLVNLQNQLPEHEIEVLIGNTVISVRGTLFLAGVYSDGEAIITVLEGRVYVNGVVLGAGFTMRVLDGVRMVYEITPTVFDELDGFQISAILDNSWLLLEAGAIDRDTIDEVYALSGGGNGVLPSDDHIDVLPDEDNEDEGHYLVEGDDTWEIALEAFLEQMTTIFLPPAWAEAIWDSQLNQETLTGRFILGWGPNWEPLITYDTPDIYVVWNGGGFFDSAGNYIASAPWLLIWHSSGWNFYNYASSFQLFDFDKSGIPDVVVHFSQTFEGCYSGWTEVFRYVNGAFVSLARQGWFSSLHQLFVDDLGRVIAFKSCDLHGEYSFSQVIITDYIFELHTIASLDDSHLTWQEWHDIHWSEWGQTADSWGMIDGWLFHNPTIVGTDIRISPLEPFHSLQETMTERIMLRLSQ